MSILKKGSKEMYCENAIGRGKEIFDHGVEIRLFPKKHQKVMNRITAPFKRRI